MKRYEGMNLGGVKTILLAEWSKVTVPQKENLGFSDLMVLEGYEWTEVPFTLETAFWSENEKRDFRGIFYEKELEFFIPAIREEICSLFSEFKGRRLIALVTDRNGHSRLLFPLVLETRIHVPASVSGYNGYQFRLAGKAALSAPRVDMDH
jgi:hypothetical protein